MSINSSGVGGNNNGGKFVGAPIASIPVGRALSSNRVDAVMQQSYLNDSINQQQFDNMSSNEQYQRYAKADQSVLASA
jgi:hypothetical protein